MSDRCPFVKHGDSGKWETYPFGEVPITNRHTFLSGDASEPERDGRVIAECFFYLGGYRHQLSTGYGHNRLRETHTQA